MHLVSSLIFSYGSSWKKTHTILGQIKSDHKVCSDPSESSKSDTVSRIEHEAVLRELEMSKSSLRALQTQLEEQTRNAREQIDSLMEDRKAIQEEMNSLRKRHEEKIRISSEQYVLF